MFLKLLKHDLISLKNSFLVLFLVVGLVAVTLPFLIYGTSLSGEEGILGILSVVLTLLSAVFGYVAGILYLIVVIRFLYRSLFGKEAPLTWSLPAKTHETVLSKLSAVVIWGLAFILIIAIGMIISIVLILLLLDRSLFADVSSALVSDGTSSYPFGYFGSLIFARVADVFFYLSGLFFVMSLSSSHGLKKKRVLSFILLAAGLIILHSAVTIILGLVFPLNEVLVYLFSGILTAVSIPLLIYFGIRITDQYLEIA